MARLHYMVSIARPDQWIGGHDIHYSGEMQCRWWCIVGSMELWLGHTERESFGVITHWIAVRALLLLFFFCIYFPTMQFTVELKKGESGHEDGGEEMPWTRIEGLCHIEVLAAFNFTVIDTQYLQWKRWRECYCNKWWRICRVIKRYWKYYYYYGVACHLIILDRGRARGRDCWLTDGSSSIKSHSIEVQGLGALHF